MSQTQLKSQVQYITIQCKQSNKEKTLKYNASVNAENKAAFGVKNVVLKLFVNAQKMWSKLCIIC